MFVRNKELRESWLDVGAVTDERDVRHVAPLFVHWDILHKLLKLPLADENRPIRATWMYGDRRLVQVHPEDRRPRRHSRPQVRPPLPRGGRFVAFLS
jgi:hypothetical protein